ncbi:unnamed protein product [Cuscuta campestris]|uniref:DYW domain-containing protein n=1 Tax=Cuscuta campestris TaxID=132261 RepID=A0A484NH36_9ASTE|nr:unnamed protein product [Cuscuta campestris]
MHVKFDPLCRRHRDRLFTLARYYRTLLRSCARYVALDVGEEVHAAAIVSGLFNTHNSFVRNAVLHMYAACGIAHSAHKVFDGIPLSQKDAADWTALMGSYIRAGVPLNALILFVEMHRESVCVDELTMVTVLNGCSKSGHYVFGVQGHAFLIKTGLNLFVKACNAVMDLYVKCGLIDETRRVFDELKERSVVSWTILLDGAVRLEGLEIAKLVFDQMPERNKVAWTIMIAGYIENGFTMEAFKLLRTVLFDLRFELNFVTLCSWLSASAQSGNLLMGQWMHAYYLKKINGDHDIMISTSLVDMYAKCGRVNDALRVFAMTTPRNVVTWNAMLSGLAMQGKGDILVNMFDQMVREVKPDRVTFTAVLSACSHSGLVDLGRHFFYNLEPIYGIKPSIEHFSCFIDLLGRAGYLDEAKSVIEQMHIPPNEVVLGSLLGACSVHRNVEMGECLMKDLVNLYPHNTQYHVLLSNMYIVAGKRDQAISLRRILKHRGIRKVPGVSSIYIGGQIHQFSAGDISHRQIHEIYLMLDEMIQRLKLAGYVPDVACHLLFGEECVDEWEEKEQALFFHSEKLALSFGLMSTRAGMPLYIFKNLRICLDCHSAMKVASKVYDRKIVIRDRNRFHSFELGSCSCLDYW